MVLLLWSTFSFITNYSRTLHIPMNFHVIVQVNYCYGINEMDLFAQLWEFLVFYWKHFEILIFLLFAKSPDWKRVTDFIHREFYWSRRIILPHSMPKITIQPRLQCRWFGIMQHLFGILLCACFKTLKLKLQLWRNSKISFFVLY